MTKISQPEIKIKDRKYKQKYRVHVYSLSGKVDLQVWEDFNDIEAINLKMSEAECEELITRLTFALHQAREARND